MLTLGWSFIIKHTFRIPSFNTTRVRILWIFNENPLVTIIYIRIHAATMLKVFPIQMSWPHDIRHGGFGMKRHLMKASDMPGGLWFLRIEFPGKTNAIKSFGASSVVT